MLRIQDLSHAVTLDVLTDIMFDDIETANDKLRPHGAFVRWSKEDNSVAEIVDFMSNDVIASLHNITDDSSEVNEDDSAAISDCDPDDLNYRTVQLIEAYSSDTDDDSEDCAEEFIDMARARRSKTVDSASDERTVNNVMRHGYRMLNEEEKENMQLVKDFGLEFWELLDNLGSSRELSIAKTKIEEAVMWAVKDITK